MVYRASFCVSVLDVSILNLSLEPALATFTILQRSMCLNVNVSSTTTWHDEDALENMGEGKNKQRRSCSVMTEGKGFYVVLWILLALLLKLNQGVI